MMIENTAIERSDTFLRQIRDLDITVDASARDIWVTKDEDGNELKSFAHLHDVLHLCWNLYLTDSTDDSKKAHYARKFAYMIDHAYLCGVIRQGEGVIRKLREYSEENKTMKSEIEELSAENLELINDKATLSGQLTECEKLHGLYAKKDA